MRYFRIILIVAIAFAGAARSAAAQQPPTPTAEPGDSAPDLRRVPAKPPASPRRPVIRREPAIATRTPPDTLLGISGVATLGMMTGGLNGTFVQIGSDIASVASSDTLRVVPLMGKGSLQNLADLLNFRGVDLALVAADSARAAEATSAYSGLRSRISYIAKLYDQEIHVLAGADVHAVGDLAGKIVNVDVIGSGTAVTAPAVFEAMNLSVKLAHEIPAVALEKLKRGEIAALVYVNGKPSRLFSSIPANSGLHLISLPLSEALLENYLPATLTYADYPALTNEGETVETLAVPVLLTVYNWPQGTARYQNLATFTDLFFSHISDLLQPPYHEKWHDVNIRATVPGWTRAPYAQRWLDRTTATEAASHPVQVATGFEKEEFNEWAAGIGLTKITALQSTQLFSLWKLRKSQAQR